MLNVLKIDKFPCKNYQLDLVINYILYGEQILIGCVFEKLVMKMQLLKLLDQFLAFIFHFFIMLKPFGLSKFLL